MDLVTGTLILLGAGFLVANARLTIEYLRFLRRKRAAVLTWPTPRPPHYGLTIGLGIATGILVVVKLLVVHRQAFGELMMFVYFGYLVPLSQRIGRGFYQDGIWADSVFIPYTEVGGINMLAEGKVAAGEWFDVIRFIDWHTARMQENIFGALVVPDKVAFDDDGIPIIENEVRGTIDEGIAAGGFSKSPPYTVSTPKAADISSEDKDDRVFNGIEYFAPLAGAIHAVGVRGTIAP